MNQRIKELAIQAGAQGIVNRDFIDVEKFAELIISECLGIVNRYEYSYHEADPLWETAQLIKQHFGVE